MEWCSRTNARKKFKKDHVKQKTLFNTFVEYALNNRDRQCFGCEDIELTNLIESVKIDMKNDGKRLHSIEFDPEVAPSIVLPANEKSTGTILRRAQNTNNTVEYVQITYNLKKILLLLMDCNDDVNYTNDDGQTILHIFLEEYLNEIEDFTSTDQLIRSRQLVKNLVERGASLYVYDKYQKTPLHMIMKSEDIDLLEIILAIWSNVNKRDEYGNTILHIIVDNCVNEIRYMDVIRALMLKGVDINGKNNKGLTVVHLAAENFHIEMLKLLADNGAYFDERTNEGKTPLHLACKSAALEMKDKSKIIQTINLLISQGCEIEAVDREGYMPLHYATEYGSSQLIECLLEFGANVDCRNEITWITPLFLASKANRLDNIRALMQAGADVNAEAADGSTPIFIAALMDSIESFQYLLDQGADLYQRDKFRGFTLLHVAAYVAYVNTTDYNNSETSSDAAKKCERNRRNFDVVIDKDFNVNDTGTCGVTPLHMATITENLDVIKILIERGANVNFQSDVDEWTALHIATIAENFEIVKILIEANANVNCKGGINQMTPLHLAVMKNIDWQLGKYPSSAAKSDRKRSILSKFWPGCKCRRSTLSQPKDVVLPLIENGADVNAKDACGRTPLHLATLHSNTDAMEILVKSDAQINVQDIEGRLPLHNILQNENLKGLQSLLDYGADINDIDTIELTMNAKEHLRRPVIEHAIKLNLIGLPVAEIYEQYIGAPEFVEFYNQCLAESKIFISYEDEGFSLYQFLHMDVKRQYYFNEKISSSFDTLAELFPIYSKVIRAACHETVYRKPLLELARLAWTKISTIHLPDVCIEHIFSHLNNRYLEVFGLTANSDVKIVCEPADHVLYGSSKRYKEHV